MFTAVLIARPGTLDPSLPDALRNAWGGGDVVWLSPDEAAEFAVGARPVNAAEVTEDLRKQGVDLALIPKVRRRKRLLIADMDSTMIGQECIDELAAVAGIGEKVADITARAMNGELDFEEALTERVGLLKGLDSGVIDTVFAERITLAPGGETLVRTMRADGAYAALVSGGFSQFTRKVAGALGFDEHRANRLCIADGKLTGEVDKPILGQAAKVEALDTICATLAISHDDALAVGDGANDLSMLNRAGLGVALHAKPSVAAAAPVRIDHGDLTALLYLQGYSRDDFA